MNRGWMLSEIHAQEQELVVECIQPIRWLLLLKLWECLFPSGKNVLYFHLDHSFWCHFLLFTFLLFLICKSSSTPAEDPLKLHECHLAGKYLLALIKMDLKPRDIITMKSLRNAMVVVMALGGSTNAVLHLIAIAR